MPIVMAALRSYASDHDGWFPSVDNKPYDSLQMLYPEYLPDPIDLAGISGNENEVRKRLSVGGRLDSSISSWIYWPHLNETNDERIAILWERTSGIRPNGSRASGHAVGFVDGSIRQIDEQAWEAFLIQQEHLRTNH